MAVVNLRIANVEIPERMHIKWGLRAIYGVGTSRSGSILKKLGIDPYTRGHEITEEQAQLIRNELANYVIDSDLRRLIARNIQRKIDIGCY